MKITNYSLDMHKHLLASWAASSAASQSGFRFRVEQGKELLSLASSGNNTSNEDFIEYIKEIKIFKGHKDFDNWHSKTIKMMRTDGPGFKKILEKINKTKKKKLDKKDYSYGVAAKLLNVYLKVYFLDDFESNFASFIHPPIDRLLLVELLEKESEIFNFNLELFKHTGLIGEKKIPNWTKINSEEYNEIIKLIRKFIESKDLTGLWRIEYAWKGHQ